MQVLAQHEIAEDRKWGEDTRIRTERVRIALVQAEVDTAFTLLRLAEVETCGGLDTHAADLITKAMATHKTALRYLGTVLPELEEQRRELHAEVRKLFEAIRATERHRRAAGQQTAI